MQRFYKYNRIVFYYILFIGVAYISINAFMYFDGKAFANEHEATYWEIDYTPSLRGSVGQLEGSGQEVDSLYPSYFKYYDESGRDLIIQKDIFDEYQAMNRVHYDLRETIIFLMSIAFGIGLFSTAFSIIYRFHTAGYVLIAIATFFNYASDGWLEWSVINYSFVYIFGAILIYRARFIDFNEPRIQIWPRGKKISIKNR